MTFLADEGKRPTQNSVTAGLVVVVVMMVVDLLRHVDQHQGKTHSTLRPLAKARPRDDGDCQKVMAPRTRARS